MTNPATYLDDQLEDLEPPYESPAHRRIGRVLDQHGIPFFYRQPALVYADGQHHIWRPHFTLPGYNGLVVEYAGTGPPQDNTCRQHREAVYAMNQIPVVFVDSRDISAAGWPRTLVERLTETAAQAYRSPTTAYSSPPSVQRAYAPGQFSGLLGDYR